MKKVMIWGVAAGLAVVAGAVVWKWRQLDGQRASWWRVVRTETGGTPHYDPI